MLVHVAVLGAAFLVAFLFSLVPLLQTRRLNLEAALRDGGRNLSSSGSSRATRWLATGQIAVALALLIGATLLVRSHRALKSIDTGMALTELDMFRVGLRGNTYRDPLRRLQFCDRLMESLRRLPGVSSVAATPFLYAFNGSGYQAFIQEGDGLRLADSPKRAAQRPVTTSFRETVGLRLLAGRWLDDHDIAGRPMVAVVNAGLAQKYWPQESPVGKLLRLDGAPDETVEIVGVVSDTRGLGNQPTVTDSIYLSFQQRTPLGTGIGFILRSAGPQPPERLLQQAVWSVDADMQFFAHQSVAEVYEQSAWQTHFMLLLVGGFSGLAVFLSLAGIYAVLSFMVTRRTNELGVRVALGATPGAITGLVLRDALRMTGIGIAAGCFLAVAGTRSLGEFLYNIPPIDLLSYFLSAIVMAVACATAALLPARRATRVNPIVALRAE
jgi:predicted permease